MKVLIGCEFSGIVRSAFRNKGHDAWSCDLLPADDNSGFHIEGDVMKIIDDGWDLAIFHPPCTHLATSGARWFPLKQKEQAESIEFVKKLWFCNIPKIAIENPVGVLSSAICKPSQIIHPWMFGHEASKRTCLWLKNLPLLTATNIVSKGKKHITKSGRSIPEWYNIPPQEDRWKLRSVTFTGIAEAMADQWG